MDLAFFRSILSATVFSLIGVPQLDHWFGSRPEKLAHCKARQRRSIFLFYKLTQANRTSGACSARPAAWRAVVRQYLQYRLPVLLMKS
jgi:hypothetical protein